MYLIKKKMVLNYYKLFKLTVAVIFFSDYNLDADKTLYSIPSRLLLQN